MVALCSDNDGDGFECWIGEIFGVGWPVDVRNEKSKKKQMKKESGPFSSKKNVPWALWISTESRIHMFGLVVQV